jgi:hypothetical protein
MFTISQLYLYNRFRERTGRQMENKHIRLFMRLALKHNRVTYFHLRSDIDESQKLQENHWSNCEE